MSLNQRQGVYVSTMNVLAESGVNFDDGQVPILSIITKAQTDAVVMCVTTGILAGEIEMSAEGRAKYNDAAKMTGYVKGLVNNWFRKDPRLNGDTKYVAKNPGSRAGAGDEQLKALKILRTSKEGDAAALIAIDQAIADRKAELGAAKAVTLTAEQIEAIPADLRAKLGL